MQIVVLLTVVWFGCLGAAQMLAGEVVSVIETGHPDSQRVMLSDWSNERLVIEGESRRELPLDEIVSLHFDRKPNTFSGGESLVLLTNGDRLVARPMTISGDVLTVAWKRGAIQSDVKLPLETVAALVIDLPAAKADRLRLFADLQTLPSGDDIVLLANGDRTQGEFEMLDGAFIELKQATGPLKLDRSRVRAIRFNPALTSASTIQGRRLVIGLVDGSRFTATSVELKADELKLTTPFQPALALPMTSVASCHVYGRRTHALSDREPVEVMFTPYLTAPWTLVKNANVLHGPLSLRGTEYGSGLGMHSRMSATYALAPQDQEFRATVGIDDFANGKGSVRFVIELDGKTAWASEELTGRDASLVIPPVSVRGAKRLTLKVDFGQQADVADYANWCEAVLIGEPE